MSITVLSWRVILLHNWKHHKWSLSFIRLAELVKNVGIFFEIGLCKKCGVSILHWGSFWVVFLFPAQVFFFYTNSLLSVGSTVYRGTNSLLLLCNWPSSFSIGVITAGKYAILSPSVLQRLQELLDDELSEIRLNAIRLLSLLAETPQGKKDLASVLEKVRLWRVA